MKKNLLLILMALVLSVYSMAGLNAVMNDVETQTAVLSVNRTGANVGSVTVSTNIEGVTARMVSTSHDFKTSGTNVSGSIVCPNVNANTNPTIVMVFEVEGLSEGMTIESVGLDIHALNASGEYQDATGAATRQFNVEVKANDAFVGKLENIDIAAGVNPTGGRHKVWNFAGSNDPAVTTSSPMTLTITATKGTTNGGCFFGLSEIQLNLSREVVVIPTYTVTVAETENGTVAVYNGEETVESGAELEENTSLTVVATPAEGYQLESILVNGEPLEGNTFALTADTEVSATFSEIPPVTYTVTIAETENGTVAVYNGEEAVESGSAIVEETELTVVATPAEGYQLESILVNGEPLEGNTFGLTADTEVSATFSEIPPVTYTVTIAETENGTVAVYNGEEAVESGSAIVEETELTVVATPAEGYQLESILVNGEPIEVNTFALTADTEISAIFSKIETPVVTDIDALNMKVNRTGATAETVTVATNVEGITARMISTSHNFKTAGHDISSEIICPDVNGNTSPTIVMVFEVNGLPEGLGIETIGLNIHALNMAGEYQGADGAAPREFNVEVKTNDNIFGKLENIDIAKGVNEGSWSRFKVWTVEPSGAMTTTTSPMTLTITVTKGANNNGCFFGLSEIDLAFAGEVTPVPTYTVTVAEVENGTLEIFNGEEAVESGAELEENTELTVVATPAEGYQLESILVNGEPIEGNTFTLTAETEISAVFAEIPPVTYLLTIAEAENGTIEVFNGEESVENGSPVEENTELTVIATAAEGYRLVSILVNGEPLDGNTFVMTANTTVSAEFETFTSIDTIVSDLENGVEIYNLQGVKVNSDNVLPGIYLRRNGQTVTKIYVR
ncbi:MAG: hypothetical protein NC336_00010 [Clostridium sp.]|nr:hypothetical protein [Clostridium sp.]